MGGVVSTTGVGGLTIHGGYGHPRRKHGLSLDSLVSVEIVTADGQVRTASATENPDLFWAVRGAGSNFGAITSFEFRLQPVGPVVQLCAPIYALEDGPRVIRAWRAFVSTAPDEVNALLVPWGMPEDEHFPREPWRRPVVVMAAVDAGPAKEGERLMQPLRELATPLMDLSGPIPYAALQAASDPFFPKRPSILLEIDLRRRPQRRGDRHDGRVRLGAAFVHGRRHVLAPWRGHGPNYDRLVALKTRYDPDNLFRVNLNIPPRA